MLCAGPHDSAYLPVISENRDGAHTGAVEYAVSYRTPSRANASRFGVRANGSPYAPMNGLLSSLRNHTKFGRPTPCASAAAVSADIALSAPTAPAPPARN